MPVKPLQLVLASASPRRAELLRSIGIAFTQCALDLDESVQSGESPQDYVLRLARAKAEAGWRQVGQPAATWVLGSDTSVVLDEQILGKPIDEADCLRLLQALSGRRHQVMTAIALVGDEGCLAQLVTTWVEFREIAAQEMRAYWASGEPRDKAGGYGIQGKGGIFVKSIEGSYSAVVGLPLYETATMLATVGFDLWSGNGASASPVSR